MATEKALSERVVSEGPEGSEAPEAPETARPAADLSHPDHKGRVIRHCVDPEKYGINSSHYVL